jgi:hypothetical protein
VAGDCQKAVCTAGACGFAADDSDLPADDGNPCTTDTCSNGVVVHTPVAEGQTCGAGMVCNGSGQCVGCNKAADCPAPSSACQVATCSSGTCGFANVTDGLGCNDGNLCTAGDHCQAGACVPGTPVTCTASDQCHVAGTCNPATGVCSNPIKPDGSACDDGNLCTTGDVCMSGVCQAGGPVTCTASDACHVAGTCNPATGVCSNPNAPNGTACGPFPNAACQNGACLCTPSDSAQVCGIQMCGNMPDGCGGQVSCGTCLPGETCAGLMCLPIGP